MRTRKFDLDDIGHIGGDRPYTEDDARIVSAIIQAQKAKRPVAKKAANKAPTKRRTRAKVRA